jgi:hypothetical protein
MDCMTLLSVEIPQELLEKLKHTGRSPQEIIVAALEEKLEHGQPPRPLEPSREERAARLLAAGFVREPDAYDNPDVQAWIGMPEKERKQLISEMEAMWFADSAISQSLIENRT